MSRQHIDRRIRSKNGKGIQREERILAGMRGESFAAAVAAALREDFGHLGSSIKTVASVTGANERAVRNWFEAKNAPTGFHLVDLMQHSDRVLEVVLLLSGRRQIARDMTLSTLCDELHSVLGRIESLAADAENTARMQE